MTTPFPPLHSPVPPGPPGPPVPPTPVLHLVVRFLALPDVPLAIPEPDRFTVVRLKVMLRRALEQLAADDPTLQRQKGKAPEDLSRAPTLADASQRRLRLLYGGRSLGDDAVLGHVLRPFVSMTSMTSMTPAPNRTRTASSASVADDTALLAPDGVRERSSSTVSSSSSSTAPPAQRVIVSCSVGDVLSAAELADEATAAALSEAAPAPGASHTRHHKSLRRDIFHRRNASVAGAPGPSGVSSSSGHSESAVGTGETRRRTGPGPGPGSLAARAPRGFERLLQNSDISAAEVNRLRLQFHTIQAARFTPDTMPSPDTLRSMEESWLDSTFEAPAGDDAVPDLADDEGRFPGIMELMVKAMLVGFTMPLASACWLLREQGLWTARFRMFVSLGMALSVLIGLAKAFTGEW